jgi:acyl-CoA thioesterase
MYDKDTMSQWLGIEPIIIDLGSCSLRMVVRPDMLNGFGTAHGGITYSFADSAFAFASNSHGNQSVSIETSISHIAPVCAGDTLTAHASMIHHGKTLGRYSVDIFNQNEQLVALFNGTVFTRVVAQEG